VASAGQVLSMLCPNVEWSLIGEDFDDVDWFGKSPPITKVEFEAGFAVYDAWKIEQEATVKAKREAALAKLAALGLNEDDLKALGL